MGRSSQTPDPQDGSAARIRRAGRADIEALAAVHLASWQAGYRGMMPQDALDALTADEFTAIWNARIEEDGRETYIYFSGERAVGFVSFGPCRDDGADDRPIAEIYGLYVAGDAWGRGHGRDLLQLAVNQLQSTGFMAVMLWVLRDNDRARRFYEMAGFQLDMDGKKLVRRFDTDLHHVRYRRTLAPA